MSKDKSQSSHESKQPIFLTTRWRHLAMLNYEIDPAILEPYLPAGTELDTYDGKHYISVVGLMFLNTRLYGISVPFHRNFEELNLRFYVRRETVGEVRRGVVFVKEIVPKSAITMVARAFYNENYVTMPMRHTVSQSGETLSVSYHWQQREIAHSLAVRAGGRPARIQDDTEEEFIAEHYWGYVVQRDGGTLEYEVEHPRWRVWRIAETPRWIAMWSGSTAARSQRTSRIIRRPPCSPKAHPSSSAKACEFDRCEG